MSGHRTEDILGLEGRVFVPAVKGVVAVNAALCSSGSLGISGTGDVSLEVDVGFRLQPGITVEVVNLVLGTIIVEAVGVLAPSAGALVVVIVTAGAGVAIRNAAVLGIAIDVLLAQVRGVQANLGVGIFLLVGAVGLLQPVLCVAVCRVAAPLGGVGHHMVAVGIAHIVVNQFVTLGHIVAVHAAGPVLEVPSTVTVIDFSGHGRPHGADVLAQHHVNDAVVAAGVRLAIHGDTAIISVDVEHQGVTDELVMHDQHGAAVGCDGGAGSSVERSVRLIAAVLVAGQRRSRGGVDRGANGSRCGTAVVVHIGRGVGVVVVLFEHVHDGVAHLSTGPLGI